MLFSKYFPRFVLTVSVLFLFLWTTDIVRAAAVTWDGEGTDGTCGGSAGDGNKWSCGANWSTNTAPSSADIATFDSTSTKNSTLDTATTVAGVAINTGYTGTITHSANIEIGSTGYSQNAGVFAGGSTSVDVNGNITLGSGAAFTAPSGILYVGGTFISSGAFSANSGTVVFDATANTIIPNLGFYNLQISPASGTQTYSPAIGEKWYYRHPITIDNTDGSALSNYQIGVTVNTSSLIAAGKMKSACEDLRIRDTDGLTDLDYWIQSGCDSATTWVWVEVPSVSAASSKTIYMYYGNPDADTASDGDATFDLFDDFLGSSLDTTKWQDWNAESFGSLAVENGLLKLAGASDGSTWKARGILTASPMTIPSGGLIIEVYNKWSLVNQYSSKETRVTNGVPTNDDSGYQWRFDYSWSTILNWHRYRFIRNNNAAGTTVTDASISNDNPAGYELESYALHDYGGQKQVGTRSVNDGASFTAIWNAAQSDWTLPISRYIGYSYSNRNNTSTGYAYLDWIRVRKYTSTAPSPSLSAEVTVPSAGLGAEIDVANDLVTSGAGTLTIDLETNDGSFDVGGDFTVASGDSVLASSTTGLAVGGDFTNNGSFDAGSGTVTLDGSSQTISGDTTFYNLTKESATTDTLTFAAGDRQTVEGVMTLKGAENNVLSLRSTSEDTQWEIDPQSTRDIAYLDVQDSYNVNATEIDITDLNITSSGNNTGWGFPEETTMGSVKIFDGMWFDGVFIDP